MNAVKVKRNNSYKYYKIGKMANAVSSVNVVVQWMLSHCKFKDWCQTYYSNLFALYSLFFKFQVILCIRRVYKADAFSILLKFAASALILWYFLIIKSYIYHESIFTKLMKNVLLICFVIVELVCRWISKAFWTSITIKFQNIILSFLINCRIRLQHSKTQFITTCFYTCILMKEVIVCLQLY